MAKSGSKRKANQAAASPGPSPSNTPTKSPKTEETPRSTDDFAPDQVEGRLYMSQLTCKFLSWYFWPEHTGLSDVSSIVLAFICVIRAYSKSSEADEGTSRYFLLVEIIFSSSCSMNLLLSKVPSELEEFRELQNLLILRF